MIFVHFAFDYMNKLPTFVLIFRTVSVQTPIKQINTKTIAATSKENLFNLQRDRK